MKFRVSVLVLIIAGWCCGMTAATPIPVVSARKNSDGVTLKMKTGVMKLQVFSPRVIHVVYTTDELLPSTKSLAVIGRPARTSWKFSEAKEEIRVRTDEFEARVNRATGAIGFYDRDGNPVLTEIADGGKALMPATVAGRNTRSSRVDFKLAPDEAIYGLGQHQRAGMNYRGKSIRLVQENREVAVPVITSSRGYGVLFDNPAAADVDVGATDPATLSWTSEAADAIDYYFMFGPHLDRVIGAYRELTGAAPMFTRWTWGFWQCRERYNTQEQLLGVVAEYRKRGLPLDGIIQDWQYWQAGGWGSHEFDSKRYPDPTAMVNAVHATNAHIIISVWPRFDTETANVAELKKAGAVFSRAITNVYPRGMGYWYDAFNPEGRKLYWRQISRNLFSHGFDGWWLDASEPELGGKPGELRGFDTAAGPGASVLNAYPLMHTASVYQGQRAESPAKRVLILTRSAYAGQQRNAAVTWSGDIRGSWEVFSNQVPAGLNFSLSGIPYWNTDIGGFFGGDPAEARYAELFTRWFQFGAFCPMFRVHGTGQPKEMWRFDEATQRILADYDRLRYHLLPYIYSVSWKVSNEGYSMMRGLIMDFRQDPKVINIGDQFLLGPALMANPVIRSAATNRTVYLPKGTAWTDFWTGRSYLGGQYIDADAPINTMPLFVRGGSILPYGPDIQYASERVDPIELRIYPGADGSFVLYEDEGDNYNYEKGAHAIIPITWNEASRTLRIGKREGSFPGMLKERTFRIVWVAPGHGAGIPSTETVDAVVQYRGKAVDVSARK